MRNTVKAFLLAAGVLLSLTGCQKGSFGKVGQEVRFGAVSGQPETRTSYSNSNEGETPETTGWERIDWKIGDIFRVYSSVAARSNGSHFSDYYVNYVTKAGTISEASIENNEAGGLVWGEGENDFYALFPYNAFEVTDAAGKVSSAKAAIPATQALTKAEDGEYYPDMKYAYMLAVASAKAKSTVELNFYPYFTAFEFEVCSDKDMKIKGFKMSSSDKVNGSAATPLSGEFTATPAETDWTVDDAPIISDENRSVTATFASPIELKLAVGATKTNSAHFTVFAAPRALTYITVEFTVEVDGETKTRSLFLSYAEGNKQGKTAGTPIEFAARKKHYFKGFFIRDNYDADGLRFYLEPMWEIEYLDSTSNANNVQCTQFVVGPAYVVRNAWDDRLKARAAEQGLTGDEYDKIKNASRQTWEFLTDGSATIDYSIMLPKAGTWRVEVCGDTEAFTVTPTSDILSAAATGSTKIKLTITPKKTSAGTIWLKTFAKMEDGTEYSLDSETQLYDLRGYHKFVYNPSHEYTSNYTE